MSARIMTNEGPRRARRGAPRAAALYGQIGGAPPIAMGPRPSAPSADVGDAINAAPPAAGEKGGPRAGRARARRQ
eukprot:gene2394-13301_t